MLRRGARRVHLSPKFVQARPKIVTEHIAQGQNKLWHSISESARLHRGGTLPTVHRSFKAETYKSSRQLSHSTSDDEQTTSTVTDVPNARDTSVVEAVVDEDLTPEDMPVKMGLEIPGIVVPELPEIENEAIRTQVFTHRSVHARTAHIFEDESGKPAPDNERLEHLGDAVLQLAVTQLLHESFPCLRVGPATKIRSLAVGNSTLADIAAKYNLHQYLLLHQAQAITLKNSVHIRADVFEAYVGGLFLDQGLEVVKNWLYILFQPYVIEAYRIVRSQHGLPDIDGGYQLVSEADSNGQDVESWPSPSPPPCEWAPSGGHLSLFNQKMQQQRKTVEWIFSSDRGPGTKTTPIWRVQAIVEGECVTEGRGSTKKAAQNDAAKAGLESLGIQLYQNRDEALPRA